MRIAAEKSGLDIPNGSTLDELELIWDELEVALRPPQSAPDQTDPGQRVESGNGKHAQPGSHARLAWIIGASVAASFAFGFLVIQAVMMRSTIDEMQLQVERLELSLIQSSLQSDSPAERIDGLLKLANAPQVDPLVLESIMDRMSLEPNTNVRLASVRLLARYADQAEILTRLENATLTEESPLVALEILSILWNHDRQRAEGLWAKLERDNRFASVVQTQPERI